MNQTVIKGLFFLAVCLLGQHAYAQQTSPSNPLDDVPEAMPFDIPYGTSINLEKANQLLSAAVSEAKKRNWKLNIAVVDASGQLLAFNRMDGAQIASIAISEHKARAAAQFRRETKAFENAIYLQKNNAPITIDGVIASRGGIPLIENGKLIGAIGCSGATGSQDEVICKAAASLINK